MSCRGLSHCTELGFNQLASVHFPWHTSAVVHVCGIASLAPVRGGSSRARKSPLTSVEGFHSPRPGLCLLLEQRLRRPEAECIIWYTCCMASHPARSSLSDSLIANSAQRGTAGQVSFIATLGRSVYNSYFFSAPPNENGYASSWDHPDLAGIT